MRKVKVYKHVIGKPGTYPKKTEDGEALFHQWGVDYEELDNGTGNYSTAIIERSDGTIENVEANMIKFEEKP